MSTFPTLFYISSLHTMKHIIAWTEFGKFSQELPAIIERNVLFSMYDPFEIHSTQKKIFKQPSKWRDLFGFDNYRAMILKSIQLSCTLVGTGRQVDYMYTSTRSMTI